MTDEMPKGLKKWEAKRRLGKKRFILIYGVLAWGIPVGALTTLISGRMNGFDARSILVAAIIWPVVGALFGGRMWRRAEDNYQHFLASKEKST